MKAPKLLVAHLFPRGPLAAVGDVVGDGGREQYGFLSCRTGRRRDRGQARAGTIRLVQSSRKALSPLNHAHDNDLRKYAHGALHRSREKHGGLAARHTLLLFCSGPAPDCTLSEGTKYLNIKRDGPGCLVKITSTNS